MKRYLVCLIASFVILFNDASSARSALTIQNYNAAQHDRFANNANFIGSGFDWGGVGRTNGRWGTLISPTFVLTATHAPPSGPIRFYTSNDPNGGFVERSIVQNIVLTQTGSDKPSDLMLSRLNAEVTGVDFFPILDLPLTQYNQEIFVFGLSNTADPFTNVRLGRNNIDDILPLFSDSNLNSGNSKSDVFIYDFDNPGGVGSDEARVEGGDSGGSSFVIVNGAPTLVGIHWFQYDARDFSGGKLGSGDTLVGSFVDEINAAIAATGSLERVQTITAVPEPATVLLVGVAFVATLTRVQMRKLQLSRRPA
jgi:Trypsin